MGCSRYNVADFVILVHVNYTDHALLCSWVGGWKVVNHWLVDLHLLHCAIGSKPLRIMQRPADKMQNSLRVLLRGTFSFALRCGCFNAFWFAYSGGLCLSQGKVQRNLGNLFNRGSRRVAPGPVAHLIPPQSTAAFAASRHQSSGEKEEKELLRERGVSAPLSVTRHAFEAQFGALCPPEAGFVRDLAPFSATPLPAAASSAAASGCGVKQTHL